jgi:hypothetical protein
VLDVHHKAKKGLSTMSEPRVTAVTIQQDAPGVPNVGVVEATTSAIGRVGAWAGDTAQQFGMLLAVLMGPAVFSAYAFAAWALAANLGFTDSFVFSAGALSNWIIWLGIAVLVNTAAAILKKHTRSERS